MSNDKIQIPPDVADLPSDGSSVSSLLGLPVTDDGKDVQDAAVFASLTNDATSVLRLLPNSDDILRAVAENIQWNPSHLLNLLAFKI
ncbi:MAG: hypothetical protein LBU65_02430 [Planctomycetaceae bacterium]|jgi:hypothetical protein|nr:hypothetical protein [Planctomycetaceae bacterium]